MVVAEHPVGRSRGASISRLAATRSTAAVATAFAMTVVEPFMSTIGGSHDARARGRRGETVALDFNGCAPGAPTRRCSSSRRESPHGLFGLAERRGRRETTRHLAVAVPGIVAGLSLALERFGTMALRDVLQPAIALGARRLRPRLVPDAQHGTAARGARPLRRGGARLSEKRALVHGRQREWKRATAPRTRNLARSLEAHRGREGPAAFYRGALAGAIHDAMALTAG